MTEHTEDKLNREIVYTAVPYYKVVRLQSNPDGERFYSVMVKMEKDGKYDGWSHASKGYSHSTSAYAAMGRMVQKYIR